MLGAIKYNLTHLLDFSGRDARQTFWYFVLVLVVLNIAVSMVAMIPMMVGMMDTAFEAARSGASEESMQAVISGELSGMMGGVVWVSVISNVVTCLLLLAAFVRRLHDSDNSGWWAALAVASQALGIAITIRTAEAMEKIVASSLNTTDLGSMIERQSEVGAYGLIGWIAPIVIIAFGVMKSTDGPNRFGEAPVRF